MQKEELTKRFNSAGKSLKYAGYAFLAILAVTIISTIIVFGYPEMTADKRNVIIIIGSGFFSILPFVIAIKLIEAGGFLMKIRIKNLQIEKTETISESADLLNDLICSQKKSFLGNKNKSDILDLLDSLIVSEIRALEFIKTYNKMFDKDLITELKSLSSNYIVIESYLSCFIKYEIVQSKYPHELVSK